MTAFSQIGNVGYTSRNRKGGQPRRRNLKISFPDFEYVEEVTKTVVGKFPFSVTATTRRQYYRIYLYNIEFKITQDIQHFVIKCPARRSWSKTLPLTFSGFQIEQALNIIASDWMLDAYSDDEPSEYDSAHYGV